MGELFRRKGSPTSRRGEEGIRLWPGSVDCLSMYSNDDGDSSLTSSKTSVVIDNNIDVSNAPSSSPSLADIHSSLRGRSPSPEYSRALRKLESRAKDRLSQDSTTLSAASNSVAKIKTAELKACANCYTQTTHLWRSTTSGQTLCDACGLHWKKHGVVPPLSLDPDTPEDLDEDTNNVDEAGMIAEATNLISVEAATWSDSPTFDERADLTVRTVSHFNPRVKWALAFGPGDVVQVRAKSNQGWWYGLLKGDRGWFPQHLGERFDVAKDAQDWANESSSATSKATLMTRSLLQPPGVVEGKAAQLSPVASDEIARARFSQKKTSRDYGRLRPASTLSLNTYSSSTQPEKDRGVRRARRFPIINKNDISAPTLISSTSKMKTMELHEKRQQLRVMTTGEAMIEVTPARSPLDSVQAASPFERPGDPPVSERELVESSTTVSFKAAKKSKPLAAITTQGNKKNLEAPKDSGFNENGVPIYCICRDIDHGRMVACDGAACTVEWFHLECVGMERTPAGRETWYCPFCKTASEKTNAAEKTSQRSKEEVPAPNLHSSSTENNAVLKDRTRQVPSLLHVSEISNVFPHSEQSRARAKQSGKQVGVDNLEAPFTDFWDNSNESNELLESDKSVDVTEYLSNDPFDHPFPEVPSLRTDDDSFGGRSSKEKNTVHLNQSGYSGAIRDPQWDFEGYYQDRGLVDAAGVAPMQESPFAHPYTAPVIELDDSDRDDMDAFSDTGSLASIFSKHSITSSQTSAASAAQIELFDACLDAFAKHERFSHICKNASKDMDAAQFERNLRRLLTFLSYQLRRHVADALESQVVAYLRARVSLAAERLTGKFFEHPAKDAFGVKKRSSDLAAGNVGDQRREDDVVVEAEDDYQTISEANDTDDGELRYLPFEQVQNFVMFTESFDSFLDRLEAFVDTVRSKQCARLVECARCETDIIRLGKGTIHYCVPQQRWLCTFSTCNGRDDGYVDKSELEEHQMRYHQVSAHSFVCASSGCRQSKKVWLRVDNFRLHCRLAHPQEDVGGLKIDSTRSSWDTACTSTSKTQTSEPHQPFSNPTFKPHSWRTLALSHARNFIDDVMRGQSEGGKERVSFHCACGRHVADDYTELQKGGLDELRRTLRSMERRRPVTPSVRQHNEPANIAPPPTTHISIFYNYVISFVYNSSSNSQSSLPQHNLSNTVANGAQTPFRRPGSLSSHLVLVLPHMKRASRVHQPASDWILSDRGFFEALSQQYKTARGAVRGALSWKSLIDMRFVKFDMLRSGLAQVQKLDCIPPPHIEEYEYEPVSWTPPIGPELMLHLMEHPEQAEPDQVLFKWVPKKLREKLQACPIKGHCDGWGIQYIEDVDRERVCAVLFICGLVSIAVALAWTIGKHDVQGGFAIASTMFVILSTGIGSAETLFGGTTVKQKAG